MANINKTTTSSKKELTEKEILKQLREPKLTEAERNKLLDMLYKDVSIRKK